MELGTPEIISNSQRETNYSKYSIHAHGPVIWNIFLNKTEKIILSQHFFKCKIKNLKKNLKKNLREFEEELSLFLKYIENEAILKHKGAS